MPHVVRFGSKLLCSCIFCKLRSQESQFKTLSLGQCIINVTLSQDIQANGCYWAHNFFYS